MYILGEQKRKSVKIRLDGADRKGSNHATRQLTVVDSDVDTIMSLIVEAINAEQQRIVNSKTR